MLKIRLLGQFDLRMERKRITIPSRVGQSLLAYLALTAGTSHRREKLAGIFWPDTTDENSRKYLRQELWRIRKIIAAQKPTDAEYILADEFSLSFNRDAEYWLDVALIEQSDYDLQSLITNLSLYQGELLPGFYDDWIILERERLQTIFDARMDQLLEQLVASERWIAVQEWGERWLSLSGVREPAYRALMLASGVRGDMARVGSLYQRCIEELMENLGVEPSAETRAMYEGLLKGAKVSKKSPKFLSSGTVTFLFTDIEASTRLLSKLGKGYKNILIDYHKIILSAIEKWNGKELDRQGDSFFVTFPRALDAVQCAADLQRTFTEHTWTEEEPVRVRMGLHSGESLINSPKYVGMDVHRAARIGDAGHGGQILLSQTTRELVMDSLPPDITIRDLGDQNLKDLKSPTAIYQLLVDGLQSEFLPLRSKFTGKEAPIPGDPPFKGLQYFTEADSDLFFGREQITAKLANHLCNGHCLSVIVGASGSGKSSIVRAGLVPALKKDGPVLESTKQNADSDNWKVRVITPTAQPIQMLATKLTDQVESVSATATLIDDLMQDPRSLYLFLSRSKHNQKTVLVVDQFEELFTLCRDEFEREAYIDNLLTALDSLNGSFILIITLRADFYSHLSQYPALRDLAVTHQEYIGPMTTEELRRAIEEPAKRGLWEFETGLVDLILRDIGDEPGALPLLSHALLETWKRRAGHMLTLQGYEDAGGVHGAIAQTAENIYNSFSAPDQTILRNIFLRLTEFGEGTEDTRRRASLKELISHEGDTDRITAILNKLAEARLVTLAEDSAEVAHEALIREWPQLREWLMEDREGILLHRHLTDSTREWELLERDPGALYRGARLAQANEWEALNPESLNEKEKQFLEASNHKVLEEQREREETRERELAAAKELAETQLRSASRLRIRNRVISIIGVVALVFGMLAMLFSVRSSKNAEEANINLYQAQTAEAQAIDEQNRANEERDRADEEQDRADEERDNALTAQAIAQSRELASLSINALADDPELSILLAMEGLTLAQTREAEEALHQSIWSLRIKMIHSHPDVIESVAYSPDGSMLLTSSDDGIARVWDVDSGQTLFSLSGHSNWVNDAVFSPDGKLIATASEDGTAKVWDLETQKELLTLAGPTVFVWRIVFSPNGNILATTHGDNTVRIWDAFTGEELLTFTDNSNHYFTSVAFSPDGTLLAAANTNKIIIWDANSGEELLVIEDSASMLAFNPDGKRLVSGSPNGLIKIWDSETGSQLLLLPGHTNFIFDVEYSPDGMQIASASLDRTARIWDSSTGQELLILAGHKNGLSSVDFSPDGKSVATGAFDNTARIWDITGSGSKEVLTISDRQFRDVNFSPDDNRIVTASFEDGIVQVWDAESGQELLKLEGHSLRVNQAVFSPNGNRIATASEDNTVKVWDAFTGQELLSLSDFGEGFVADGLYFGVMDVAFSPDGTRLATASADGVAKIWDSTSGKELLTLDSNTTGLICIEFSPDGDLIAISSEEPDITTRLSIFDAETGKEIWRQTIQQDRIWGLAFSPNEEQIVSAGSEGIIKIWDVTTGNELMDIPDYTSSAGDADFSPDGSLLAIVGGDGLQLWDIEAKEKVLDLPIHSGWIWAASFTNDGSKLATASPDGTTRVIYINIEDLVMLAKSRVTRSLTTAECQQYLHMDSCP